MENLKEAKAYRFGPFLLEVAMRRLSRDGRAIPLTVKLFDILLLLVKNHGQIITKETLLSQVWPDSFVEENNLTVAVSALRKILGETPKEHEYIETVPKRGYRFVALVNEIREEKSAPASFNGMRAGAEKNATINSLAVLPLVNAKNDPNIDYLSDGITESIINCFSKLPQLRVMARSTVFRYKGKEIDPLKIGKRLRVKAVLAGNVAHFNGRIVIGMELVNVDDGTQLWGEQYKLNSTNIFDVQEQIISEVSNNLRLRLTLEEKAQLHTNYMVSPEAYRLYLKGRYFLGKRIEGNILRGIDYFQKAFAEDALYAQAHAGIADCYTLLGSYGAMPERDALALAQPAAEKALELNANLAEAHASLGFIKSFRWDWSGAEEHFKRAIKLQPSYAQARHWYSLLLMWLGRFEESKRELEYNLLISPLSPLVNTSWAVHSYFTRQYDLAIAWCRESLELDPSFYSAYAMLGLSYLQKGMAREAIEAHETFFNVSQEPEALSVLGYTYARTGRRDEAAQILRRLEELSHQKYIKPYYRAIIYFGLEETALAFDWLEKAFEDKNDLIVVLKIDPRLDAIRQDARLIELQRKMALPRP